MTWLCFNRISVARSVASRLHDSAAAQRNFVTGGCRPYLPSAIANSWLRLTRKIAPLAGTAVEYTELPMLFSASSFIVLSAAMIATSPSSSPR